MNISQKIETTAICARKLKIKHVSCMFKVKKNQSVEALLKKDITIKNIQRKVIKVITINNKRFLLCGKPHFIGIK